MCRLEFPLNRVAQNLTAALSLAQRGDTINYGRIAHEGSPLEIKAQPKIQQRYRASNC
jgi:ABC-type branched-subunit amino acid transport system ATPase component